MTVMEKALPAILRQCFWNEVERRLNTPSYLFVRSPLCSSANMGTFSLLCEKEEWRMSKYCIMRFQKYKVGSVANIERHQKHRDRLKHRKHPERESENITWRQSPEKTMTQVIRGVMREQEKQTGKKVRKDAVALV